MLRKVTIEGTTPLLMNAFTDQAAMDATNGSRLSSAAKSKGTPQEQAEEVRYKPVSGKGDMIPQPNLFSCIIEAGKFFKNGKSKITTTKSSLIPSCLAIEGVKNGAELEVKHKQPWTVDTRAVRIPATGGRILRHRPKFDDWEITFILDIDETEINEKLTREIIDAAGKKVGLGDFRPSCKGPFGKFVVKKWVKA